MRGPANKRFMRRDAPRREAQLDFMDSTRLHSQSLLGQALRGSVDVVIPVRNGEQTILPTLNSVLNQTLKPGRIFVVNDGSTDDTAHVIEKIGSASIELITTPPVGISHARNVGIARSQADFVAFLDADDRWHPDKLLRQLLVFLTDQRAGVVYCGSARLDPSGAVRDVSAPRLRGAIFHDLLAGGDAGNSSSIVVRREALSAIGGYDEALSFGEETDLLLRLARQYRFDFADDILTYVILTPDSVTRRRGCSGSDPAIDRHMELLVARTSAFEKWAPQHKISFAVAQALRKQIVAAAVRRGYGWRWLSRLRAQLFKRAPYTGRLIWRNHATFAFWIAIATLAHPARVIARKIKVTAWLMTALKDSSDKITKTTTGHRL